MSCDKCNQLIAELAKLSAWNAKHTEEIERLKTSTYDPSYWHDEWRKMQERLLVLTGERDDLLAEAKSIRWLVDSYDEFSEVLALDDDLPQLASEVHGVFADLAHTKDEEVEKERGRADYNHRQLLALSENYQAEIDQLSKKPPTVIVTAECPNGVPYCEDYPDCDHKPLDALGHERKLRNQALAEARADVERLRELNRTLAKQFALMTPIREQLKEAQDELQSIALMDDVPLGVGDGSIVDAITALVGRVVCADRDNNELRAEVERLRARYEPYNVEEGE